MLMLFSHSTVEGQRSTKSLSQLLRLKIVHLMMLSDCLGVGVDLGCKSFSPSTGNWVGGSRRIGYDVGVPLFPPLSRLSGAGGEALARPLVRWMGSFLKPPKSARPRRPGAAATGVPRSAMRKQRAGGPGRAAAGGASCRGSTLLMSVLVASLLAFFLLFGLTFRGSHVSRFQELDGDEKFVTDLVETAEEERRRAQDDEPQAVDDGVSVYGYEIVREYDHDPRAFTQGLLYAGNGTLYESTGLYGQSTVREVDLLTGKVRRTQRMSSREFGEGLTLWKDRLFQVTWRNQKVFLYDQKTLLPKGQGSHHMKDGWGLTASDEHIIGSDGTSKLYFMKPDTFEEVKVLTVKDEGKEVGWLNELEYVNGEIWANIWQGECIARISPENGKVTGWILLQGLRSSLLARGAQHMDVLNGIAWDREGDNLYVTGKMWPKLFEIKLLDKTHKTNGSLESVRTLCNIGHDGFM